MTTHYRDFMSGAAETATLADITSTTTSSQNVYRAGFKRAFDVAAILLTAVFTVPLVAMLAICVAVMDGGRPLYSQPRVGRNGRIYRIWKLRTMVTNADALLEEHLSQNPVARREWERTQKLKDDPRITRFGKVLRGCSLDELPQLWNVLWGDMSLVGPRPMMPCQQELYPGEAYYDLRPGITGYWQISERNETDFARRAHYDTCYDADLSLGTDAMILVATMGVVMRRTGY